MSQQFNESLLFFVFVAFGVFLEDIGNKLYKKIAKRPQRTIHFSIGRYLFLLLVPLLSVLFMTFIHGLSIIQAYILFAIVGTLLEWLVGFSYHQIVGQKLWTYHRYSLTGYTSFLATPIWGLAGVLFLLLIRSFQ